MKKKATGKVARVLLVDDHPLVRLALSQLLEPDEGIELVGQVNNAGDAHRMVEELKPDLVIIDIMIRGGDGIELVKQIKARDNAPKTLVASMHPERLYGERAIRAGALGYVCKADPPENLLKAVHTVLGGDVYISPDTAERILHRYVGRERMDGQPPLETLSDREMEVFYLIGQGMTTKQIAEKLHLSSKTIDTYRDLIKKKLNLENTPMLIREAVLWLATPGRANEEKLPTESS